MSSTLSIILHGNTEDKFNNGFSATAYTQKYLKKQTGGFLGAGTWAVRQFLTPVMAAVELPIRVVQLAVLLFINIISFSFLRSEDASKGATWHNRLATKIRQENYQLLAVSVSAFASIFSSVIGSSCPKKTQATTSSQPMYRQTYLL